MGTRVRRTRELTPRSTHLARPTPSSSRHRRCTSCEGLPVGFACRSPAFRSPVWPDSKSTALSPHVVTWNLTGQNRSRYAWCAGAGGGIKMHARVDGSAQRDGVPPNQRIRVLDDPRYCQVVSWSGQLDVFLLESVMRSAHRSCFDERPSCTILRN